MGGGVFLFTAHKPAGEKLGLSTFGIGMAIPRRGWWAAATCSRAVCEVFLSIYISRVGSCEWLNGMDGG